MVVEQPRNYWREPAVADDYERGRFHGLHGRLYRWREERAIERALQELRPGSTVLDAACGTGRIMALLRRNGFRATGCDISRAMMAVARRRLQSLGVESPLVESEIQHLPYRARSFEAVTCIGLLMHFGPDARVQMLRELARVSRSRLVVQYGCLAALPQVKAYISGRPPGHVAHPVSDAELRLDLQRSGLTERARFRPLRGMSSSIVVVLTS